MSLAKNLDNLIGKCPISSLLRIIGSKKPEKRAASDNDMLAEKANNWSLESNGRMKKMRNE